MSGHVRRALLLATLWLLAFTDFVHAQQLYQAGQIVNTNTFVVYARRPFTNMAGRVFFPGAQVRLTDLHGYVVFAEFFDPT